jgi:ABC-type uncharacterized transport system substrate-binding protein
MRRREFITLLGGATVAWPLASHAQQPDRVRRIGVLMLYPENDPEGQLRATALRVGLQKRGWAVGGNIEIDFQWGLSDADWIRSAGAQLLRLAPDMILANGTPAARTMQQLTRTVPVIFIAGSERKRSASRGCQNSRLIEAVGLRTCERPIAGLRTCERPTAWLGM